MLQLGAGTKPTQKPKEYARQQEAAGQGLALPGEGGDGSLGSSV